VVLFFDGPKFAAVWVVLSKFVNRIHTERWGITEITAQLGHSPMLLPPTMGCFLRLQWGRGGVKSQGMDLDWPSSPIGREFLVHAH